MTKKEIKEHILDNTAYVEVEQVVKVDGKDITFTYNFYHKSLKALTFNGEITKTYKLKNKIIAYDVYIF